ncbi:MAG TPA: hypothetical protein PKJ99_11620 [Thermoanaerobaculales bacterium]|nr:hypothetical protein [Thermoanaerobaculales bacterium]HPA82308.1 hypothetical protein [Thermoanaerobaculales bacterium]HQP44010.1 hypothetical protein [Thermoanaerobaculales bacterium]
MTTDFSERLVSALDAFLEAVLRFLPGLLAAVLIMIVGLVAAWVLKLLVTAVLRAARFDRYCDGSGISLALSRADIRASPSLLVGRGVFWLFFLSLAVAGMSAMQVAFLSELISGFFLYLPRLVSALLILLLGFLLANFLSRAALLGAVNSGAPSPRLISVVVRLLIMVLAFAMALEQLRIAPHIVLAAFIIAFGAVMSGLALAFGLGGREVAKRTLENQLVTRSDQERDGVSHL